MAPPDPPRGPDAGPSAAFLRAIARRAEPDGFVPFDRFVEVALYDPDVGRYARADSPLGRDGDFYTAPDVHPLFAETVADRIRTSLGPLLATGPASIVEIGPGDGTLAAGILTAFAERPLPPGAEYRLVERSAARRASALRRAAAVAPAGIDVRAVESVGADGPFRGVVVANELFDALPHRRLSWTGRAWEETGVRRRGNALEWARAPPVGAIPPPPLPTPTEAGTIFEVGVASGAVIRELADHLVAGEAILLDYGMGEEELVRGHPGGTVRAVRRHRPVRDLLADPGDADLSVFVNFDRLRAAAATAGLAEIAFRSQAEALGAWGFPARYEAARARARDAEAAVRLQLAAKQLLFGFERFAALELRAGRN